MARLNDPPAPAAESIDALKRRFIRQNRDLARVNSNQSQRIRNLETEISRLLAENIALREQAINSAAEAEKWRTSNRLGKDVMALKEMLAAKLGEVHAMVEELGTLPEKSARRSSERRRRSGLAQNAVKSPDMKEWRNRQTMGGVLSADSDMQEGRLPAILEDKYYPRRTLEVGELRLIQDEEKRFQHEDTESPDLGPPPVAHFEVAEPITFDSTKSPKRVSGGIMTGEDEVLTLPSNLETRRKRRTSSLLQDMPVVHKDTTSDDQTVESVALLKSGAKRKLDATQLEETVNRPVPADTFIYQRKSTMANTKPKPSRFTAVPVKQHQDAISSLPKGTPASPQKVPESARTALAPKSTNSPVKKHTSAGLEKDSKESPSKDDRVFPVSGRSRARRPLQLDLPLDPEPKSQLPLQQPKTPGTALTELMSPSSIPTQPSTRSVPSEIAITNSVEDVLNGSIGRGSRRARAAVSYAEPNLRDKMRRPDKKLVGAVEGLAKRDTNFETDTDPVQLIQVKPEPATSDADDQWKSLPADKQITQAKEEPTSPLTDKERKAVPLKPSERNHKRTFSEAEGTSRTTNLAKDATDLDQAVQHLSIFDPPASSPLTENSEKRSMPGITKSDLLKQASSTHSNTAETSDGTSHSRTRRHSVQPQSSSLSRSTSHSSIGHALSRPNSAVSLRDPVQPNKDSSMKLKRANSVQSLSQGQIQNQLRIHSRAVSAKDVGLETDEERGSKPMSTRRRSMMV